MVGPDGETETVHNVEVITNLAEGTPGDMQDVQYIMVNQGNNEFIILNEQDGGQLSLAPDGSTVTLPQGDVTASDDSVQTALDMVQKGDTIETVAVAPDNVVDGDTIYKAMMVANVVEEMETDDTIGDSV